jgi:hypothetical protein
MSIVTIATDYSTEDGYVGSLKGLIKSLAPLADIVDITHDLKSIFKTALVLTRYFAAFPANTVHLVIIDPTVGTARRAIAGKCRDRFFVGPDNGIFTYVISASNDLELIEISPDELPDNTISATFHGRDIFAPAAAMIAGGASLDALGIPISDPILLTIPEPIIEPDRIIGEIIDVDSFGNLIINIPKRNLGTKPKVIFKGAKIPFAQTFADVERGHPLAYIGSLGYLELAINLGSAVDYFATAAGAKVTVSK